MNWNAADVSERCFSLHSRGLISVTLKALPLIEQYKGIWGGGTRIGLGVDLGLCCLVVLGAMPELGRSLCAEVGKGAWW